MIKSSQLSESPAPVKRYAMNGTKTLKLAWLLPVAVLLVQCNGQPQTYAFDVNIKVSPQAEAAMQNPGSRLAVHATYYGYASPAHSREADNFNRIYLGEETWTYSGKARRLHLHGGPIDTARLPHTRDGQPWVVLTINAERSGSVSCQPFIGPIRLAQQHSPIRECELDSERYWENMDASASAE